MTNTLRISLVALFAALPMMAMAADTYPVTADPGATTSTAPKAANAPKYAMAQSAATDVNAASAGYVKGAYNAAMKAINYVHDEVVAAQSTANDAVKGVKVNGSDLTKDSSGKVDVTVVEGTANGTIKVNGAAVNVHGLSSAAYSGVATSIASNATGLATAQQVYNTVAGLDATVSQAAATDKPAITVKEVDGKLTEVTASIGSGTISKDALATAVQSSLNKADTAVQSITTGSANGKISVDGTDVAVKGLASAAYKGVSTSISSSSTDSDLATAKAVYTYASGAVNGLDATVSQAAATDKPAITVKEVNGKLTEVTASIGSGTISKDALATAVQSSLNKADTAIQSGNNISLLNNNAGYITKDVNNLSNYTSTTALQSNYATKTGVAATVNSATGSVTGVSLGVNFGTITTNTSALKVSVPTKASYDIMQTWGSDSATSGSYSLGTNSNVSVSGTATTSIGATTATGSISGIDISVASYVAE